MATTGTVNIATPGYIGPYTKASSVEVAYTHSGIISAGAMAAGLLQTPTAWQPLENTLTIALDDALKGYTSSIYPTYLPTVANVSIDATILEEGPGTAYPARYPVLVVGGTTSTQSGKTPERVLAPHQHTKHSVMTNDLLTTPTLLLGLLAISCLLAVGVAVLYAKARREIASLHGQLQHAIAELGLAKLQSLGLDTLPTSKTTKNRTANSTAKMQMVSPQTLTLDKIVKGLCADDGKTRMASLRELGSLARQHKAVRPRLMVILKTYLVTLLGEEDLRRTTNREVIMCLRQLSGLNEDGEPLDLHGLNFAGVHFEGFSLKNIDFRGCNFGGATWQRVRLRGCDLRGADFSEATITQCELFDCNLPRPAIAQQAAVYHGVQVVGAAMTNPATLAALGARTDADRRAAAIAAFQQGDFILDDQQNFH